MYWALFWVISTAWHYQHNWNSFWRTYWLLYAIVWLSQLLANNCESIWDASAIMSCVPWPFLKPAQNTWCLFFNVGLHWMICLGFMMIYEWMFTKSVTDSCTMFDTIWNFFRMYLFWYIFIYFHSNYFESQWTIHGYEIVSSFTHSYNLYVHSSTDFSS